MSGIYRRGEHSFGKENFFRQGIRLPFLAFLTGSLRRPVCAVTRMCCDPSMCGDPYASMFRQRTGRMGRMGRQLKYRSTGCSYIKAAQPSWTPYLSACPLRTQVYTRNASYATLTSPTPHYLHQPHERTTICTNLMKNVPPSTFNIHSIQLSTFNVHSVQLSTFNVHNVQPSNYRHRRFVPFAHIALSTALNAQF